MYSVITAFGGRKHLGAEPKKNSEFDSIIRKGIPVAAGNYIKELLRLSDKEFADAIGLSQRTLIRKKKASTRLSTGASDRLYRLARIFAFAVEVLGDEQHAREWLHDTQIALGNRTPLDMMRTDAGAGEVESLLGRIKHGVVL